MKQETIQNPELKLLIDRYSDLEQTKQPFYYTIIACWHDRQSKRVLVSHLDNKTATGVDNLLRFINQARMIGADYVKIFEYKSYTKKAQLSQITSDEHEIVLNEKKAYLSGFGGLEGLDAGDYMKSQIALGTVQTQIDIEKERNKEINKRLETTLINNEELARKNDELKEKNINLEQKLKELEFKQLMELQKFQIDKERELSKTKEDLSLRNMLAGFGLNFAANKLNVKPEDVLGMLGGNSPQTQPQLQQHEIEIETALSKEKQPLGDTVKNMYDWLMSNIQQLDYKIANSLVVQISTIFNYSSESGLKLKELYDYVKTKENGTANRISSENQSESNNAE